MKKILFFSLFLIFFLITQVNAQLSPLATGLQKYRQGDLEGAVIEFENALAQDKENEKIKTYLFNCYLALGVRYGEEKNYTKALDYLDRAQKLNPLDQEAKDLYQTVKTKLAPPLPKPAVAPKTPEAPPKPVGVTPSPVAKPEAEKAVTPEVPKEVPQPPVEVKEAVPIPPKVEKKPTAEKVKEIKPTPTPPAVVPKVPTEEKKDELEEKLKLVLVRIEREREDLLRYLTSWEEKERRERERILHESQKFMQRTILIVGIGLLFLTFFILGPIYSKVKQTSEKREEIFREYEERITKMIEEHKTSLANFIALQTAVSSIEPAQPKEVITPTEKTEPPEPITSPEEIIEGTTPELRLRAINIIEKELSYENETEKIVAFRLLEPFLNDTDKKVQLQATKTLSKYAPEKIANLLRDSISKKGKEISSEMLRSFTDLPPIRSAEILISFLNHPDYKIREQVAFNLEHLLQTRKDELPPAVIDRIEKVIEKITTGKRTL